MANGVDPDQRLHSAASDLGLQFAKAYLSQYLGFLWYTILNDRFHLSCFITINLVLVAFTSTEHASVQKSNATCTQVLQHLQMDLVKIIVIWCLRALSVEFWL